MDKLIQDYMNIEEEPESAQLSIDRQIALSYLTSFDDEEDLTTTSESEGDHDSTPRRQVRSDLNVQLGDDETKVKTDEGNLHQDEAQPTENKQQEWEDEDLFLFEQFDIPLALDPYWMIKRAARYIFYALIAYILYFLFLRFFPDEI